jgi:hypothetical protein
VEPGSGGGTYIPSIEYVDTSLDFGLGTQLLHYTLGSLGSLGFELQLPPDMEWWSEDGGIPGLG